MRYAVLLVLLLAVTSQAQVLRDINYSYLYSPIEPFVLNIKIARSSAGWTAYEFTLTDTTQDVINYRISGIRNTVDEKQGIAVDPATIQNVTTKPWRKISLPSTIRAGSYRQNS
jgi:hypothetical protein